MTPDTMDRAPADPPGAGAPSDQDPAARRPTGARSPRHAGIARDLLRRNGLSEALRSVPAGERTDAQAAELLRTDRAHAETLLRVLDDHGWPGVSLIGAEAARAAWLIALRSDDAELQAVFLTALADAVAVSEAAPAWWAHLYDRCCARTGVKQWFGTQFMEGADGVEVYPVDDPDHLGLRRARYGLGPHEAAAVRQRCGADGVTTSACPGACRDAVGTGMVTEI